MTTKYLNSAESFEDLVLSDFITKKTIYHTRTYSTLMEANRIKQYSFNSFVEDVLSYKSPHAYMKSQRNTGKITADFFIQKFPKYLEIYNCHKNNESERTSSSITFSANYKYVIS
jgi:hypothetical protein